MIPKLDNKNTNENEIDLKSLFRICIRNKLFISVITSTATLSTIFFSLSQTPIYQGNFQILVSKNEGQGFRGDNTNEKINLLLGGESNDNKTQEYILKSPLVLKPVFNLAIEEYKKRGDTSLLSYEMWVKKYLQIGFEDGTQVLKISFQDSDKDFILEILNQISKKYQNYSKQVKERDLIKTLNYLNKQQKALTKISQQSLKELNSFSLKNGLGSLDGLFSIESVTPQEEGNKEKVNIDGTSSNMFSKDASQRYKNQFKVLEEYEAALTNYSSKLKPNSQLIKNLKLKIKNLKENLKRPNEILLTYRELTKIAIRDESLLFNIDKQLEIVKLEIAKQRDPWELISVPTISKDRISPQRKKTVMTGFVSSLLIASFLSIWKEKKTGKVYELSDLISLLNCNYLDSLYLNNDYINIKLIEDALKKGNKNQSTKKSNQEFSILKFTKDNINYFIRNYSFINFKNEEISKNNKLIIFISPGMINLNQIVLLNKYIKIYPDKFIGWFYLNDQEII